MTEMELRLPRFDGVALCRQVGGDMFFPEVGENTTPAKRVCARCEVQEQCLRWALANGEHGIWGGTSERQRRRMKQRGAA